MKNLDVFLYEWKHFIHSPFKAVALVLFIIAGVYGLHNGATLYHQHVSEIKKIEEKVAKERQRFISYYEDGKKGPPDRPWVDMSTPFWAVWNTSTYYYKKPSPAMVYSIGQAEQYGFYKKINTLASPYDSDMSEEIANPERLQTGMLDFAFAGIYLLPLLMLILLYNLRSAEVEQGFLPLIEVQTASKKTWLLSRMLFYVLLVALVIFALLLYGAMLTGVFTEAGTFGQKLMFSYLYLFLWSLVFYFILRSGTSILSNTLKMVSLWLLFSFIIPATVHQYVTIAKPANLMTGLIDVKRDKQDALFAQSDSAFQAQLNALFPDIVKSPVFKDDKKSKTAMNRSYSALVNELMKSSVIEVEDDNASKNKLIQGTFWFNPIPYFQNQFNRVSETHYDDYQHFRENIQTMVDKHIQIMVQDIWNDVKVDKEKYIEYTQKAGMP